MPEKAATIRDTALRYYDEYGWFVIPADPESKTPYFAKNGYETFRYKERYGNTLPPREDVESWEQWNAPGVRIGVRTGAVSGIVVLDVDSEEAKSFVYEKRVTPGPIVESPRANGGMHYYYRHPGFHVKTTVSVGGVEGLDIRGDGGIVVVPPSTHKNGKPYEWVIPPEDLTIPSMPGWLRDIMAAPKMKEPLDVGWTMAGIPEGQRDTELNRLAGKFRYWSLPQDLAEKWIQDAAAACQPAFNRAEARAKVVWAYTHYAAGEWLSPTLNISDSNGRDEPDTDEDGFVMPVILGTLDEPGPREWVVDNLIPAKYPTTMYGTGGVSKSYIALTLGTSVAAGFDSWMDFKIKNGAVLYLDFELEVQEQTRRAYKVARGLGLDKPPKDLLYLNASNMRTIQAFQTALHWCRKHEVVLMIVDSTGLAVDGDSERSQDVISFFREVVGQFVAEGTCPLLIDHQAKMQAGENYQRKSAFGSGFKEYLSRSAIQIELIRRGEGTIEVRFYQKKTNFGPAVEPFDGRVEFKDASVEIERIELDDGELATVEILGAEERVKSAIRYLGNAIPPEVSELSGLALGTVRKEFSKLKKRGVLVAEGDSRENCAVVKLAGPAQLVISENTVNPVNAEADDEYF